MRNGAELTHVAEALDRMAKSKGLNEPQFPAERAREYWEAFVSCYFSADFPKPERGRHETAVFDNLLEQVLRIRGVTGLSSPDQLGVISSYHRTLVLNFFDKATDGRFFAAAHSFKPSVAEPGPKPGSAPLPHVDFDGIARGLAARTGRGAGTISGDECNDLAKTVASANLRMIAAAGVSLPPVMFRSLSLLTVARSLVESWNAGTLGEVAFFIEEDRTRTWRETQDYDDFEALYLREGLRVVLVAPEETAMQREGYRCRLATLYPRFPDTYEYRHR